MGWRLAADGVLVVHFGFVLFIVAGGVFVRARSWVLIPHVASLAYGAAIEVIGFTCPLTPLEKWLRRAAGEAGYDGGFIDHYITSVLYPGELTWTVTAALVAVVAAVNVATYCWALHRPPPSRASSPGDGPPPSPQSARPSRRRAARLAMASSSAVVSEE